MPWSCDGRADQPGLAVQRWSQPPHSSRGACELNICARKARQTSAHFLRAVKQAAEGGRASRCRLMGTGRHSNLQEARAARAAAAARAASTCREDERGERERKARRIPFDDAEGSSGRPGRAGCVVRGSSVPVGLRALRGCPGKRLEATAERMQRPVRQGPVRRNGSIRAVQSIDKRRALVQPCRRASRHHFITAAARPSLRGRAESPPADSATQGPKIWAGYMRPSPSGPTGEGTTQTTAAAMRRPSTEVRRARREQGCRLGPTPCGARGRRRGSQ